MMHGDERDVGAEGETFGIVDAHEERADEPGGVRYRDGVEIGERAPRVVESLSNHRYDRREVRA